MKSKFLISATVVGLAAMSAVTVGYHAEDIKAANNDYCFHNGYHYYHKDGSATEHGYQEYWVCCKCHEHWTSNPGLGSFVIGEHRPAVEDVPTDLYTHNYDFLDSTIDYEVYCTVSGCDKHRNANANDLVLSKFLESTGADAAVTNGQPEWAAAIAKEGSLAWQNSQSAAARVIYMPKINFGAFDSVQLDFRCDATGSTEIQLGVQNVGSITDFVNHQHIIIEVTSLANGNLKVAAQEADQPQNRLSREVPKSKLNNGRLPITVSRYKGYPHLALETIRLNHVHDTMGMAPSKFRIGHYDIVCHECGEQYDHEAYGVMTSNDIDLVECQYGADAKIVSGVGSCGVSAGMIGGQTRMYYNYAAMSLPDHSYSIPDVQLYMPKVQYDLYNKVVFSMNSYEQWGSEFGWDAYDLCPNYNGNFPINITVTKSGNSYSAKMDMPARSWSKTIAITDADIIAGKTGLPIYARVIYTNGLHGMCLDSVTVEK